MALLLEGVATIAGATPAHEIAVYYDAGGLVAGDAGSPTVTVAGWVAFRQPHPLDYNQLVELERDEKSGGYVVRLASRK